MDKKNNFVELDYSETFPSHLLDEITREYIEKMNDTIPAKNTTQKVLGPDPAPPPSKRSSVFGNVFPKSTEEEWRFHKGAGWVHTSEAHHLPKRFVPDCTGYEPDTLFPIGEMLLTYQDKYILPKRAKQLKWVKCGLTAKLMPLEETIEGLNNDNKLIKVWKGLGGNSGVYATCDYYHNDQFLSRCVAPVKVSTTYRVVSYHALKNSGCFTMCGACSHWFEKGHCPPREDFANKRMCQKCFSSRTKGTVILKHDNKDYPGVLRTPIYRMGHKEVDGLIVATHKKELYHDVRLFGVELETEMSVKGVKKDDLDRFTIATSVKDVLGKDFVMTKEDGTLNTNGKYSDDSGNGPHYAGFEIVSAPADLAIHRLRWEKLWEVQGYKHLRAWDTTTCGFHVHVSREALTSLQIGRLLKFINHSKNQKFVKMIAGRGQHEFCRYVDRQYGDALKVETRNNQNRRQAINLTNEHTIEFRMFRGTVHPNHIIRNLEFVDAVCDYCYPCARGLLEFLDHKSFLGFVSENRKKYSNLTAWFILQKMLPGQKLGPKADKTRLTIKPDMVVEGEIKLDEQIGKGKPDFSTSIPEGVHILGGANIAEEIFDTETAPAPAPKKNSLVNVLSTGTMNEADFAVIKPSKKKAKFPTVEINHLLQNTQNSNMAAW